MKGARILAATFWVLGSMAGRLAMAAAPQQGAPQQRAERTTRSAAVTAITSKITVDGALDEPAWSAAPKIGELIQRMPATGQPPSERTEVTLLHDADHLYIGVMCYDSEPRRIIGTQLAHDAGLNSDDRLEIVLDTFRDQSNAFYFATNPVGALVDGLAFTNGQLSNEWDGVWDVRTKRTDEGWAAEFAIPFKTVSFPADRTVWGFNIARHIYRKQEEARWSGARLEVARVVQVSEAGEVTGLQGLSQGVGLEVRPFTAGRWLHLGGRDTTTGKPGLDMFYNITPSLKLTATVNTDFGETEVDARQINLSRFSLFFPEKRSFFLEDAGVFSFVANGPAPSPGLPVTGADMYPFFSRQIGLLAGEEVPIDFGLKLTGKVGRTDLGVLDVRTRDVLGVPEKNFFVGRVRQNFLQQSYVGAILTDGHPSQTRTSRTFGADVRLATSRMLGRRQNLVINAYGVRSQNQDTPTRDWSYGFTAEYPNDKYSAQVVMRDIQQNFRPALGFVQRRNVRLLRVAGGFAPRPKKFMNLQQAIHDLQYTRFTRLDNGEVESWEYYQNLVDWHFKSGDSVHSLLDFNPRYERLFAPFVISPGVVLPPGEYRFTRWGHFFMSANRRKLQAQANFTHGSYWSGRGETLTAGMTYKLPPRLIVQLNTNQTFARLPQGKFIARIYSTNVNYNHSPFLAFSNLLQYDNLSRNLGWQSRARWTLQPGNDLFFVFSQGWLQDTIERHRFTAQDSKVSAKFQYSLRF